MFSYALACAALSLTGPAQSAEPVKALVYESMTVSYGEGGVPGAISRNTVIRTDHEILSRHESIAGTTLVRAAKAEHSVEIWNSREGKAKRFTIPSDADYTDVLSLFGGTPETLNLAEEMVARTKKTDLGKKIINGRSCVGERAEVDNTTTERWSLDEKDSPVWYQVDKTDGATTSITYGLRYEETSDWDRSQFNIPASK